MCFVKIRYWSPATTALSAKQKSIILELLTKTICSIKMEFQKFKSTKYIIFHLIIQMNNNIENIFFRNLKIAGI